LAGLFKQVAVETNRKELDLKQSRSLTEAFLFQRLETVPQTAGRFRLNVESPIPFNNSGCMEVDLLCTDARIAIEIDGSQHLSDANAWRRDRRKDALLQENGYMVLRSLAEDIGKQLDNVLDCIHRALSIRHDKKI
jgi:very-short-patch-repair endonuclease